MDALNQILAQLEQLNQTLTKLVPASCEPPDWESAKALRWQGCGHRQPLKVINHVQPLWLHDLLGIDQQKATLDRNTRQFLRGLPANNALLWGAKGTGKSSLI